MFPKHEWLIIIGQKDCYSNGKNDDQPGYFRVIIQPRSTNPLISPADFSLGKSRLPWANHFFKAKIALVLQGRHGSHLSSGPLRWQAPSGAVLVVTPQKKLDWPISRADISKLGIFYSWNADLFSNKYGSRRWLERDGMGILSKQNQGTWEMHPWR